MAKAYYNEIDPYCAEWLNNLILEGEIAYGDVDTRSIEDVRPSDLAGYTQCHFFAGIGVWSRSLRLAGWPDDRPVWTGSCPCQPFSAAGKRGGAADERHLWPAWSWLIRECKPRVVFGEQVASKDGRNWLDLVQTDLEAMGFAVAAGDICAAGVGAPHIRQRLYFVADSERDAGEPGRAAIESAESVGAARAGAHAESGRRRVSGVVGNPDDAGSQGRRLHRAVESGNGAGERTAWPAGSYGDESGHATGCEGNCGRAAGCCGGSCCACPNECDGNACILADPDGGQSGDGNVQRSGEHGLIAQDGGAGSGVVADSPRNGRREEREDARREYAGDCAEGRSAGLEPSRVSSFWSACDWLPCIDGKARPVEPGTFPLAHGIAGRVGRLRAYGNAIVAPCAKEFIKAYLDAR